MPRFFRPFAGHAVHFFTCRHVAIALVVASATGPIGCGGAAAGSPAAPAGDRPEMSAGGSSSNSTATSGTATDESPMVVGVLAPDNHAPSASDAAASDDVEETPNAVPRPGRQPDSATTLFVAPRIAVEFGDSSPDGSMTHPYPTISEALRHLTGQTRVDVCNGVYRDQVALTASMHASLHGGFDCAHGWRWSGAATRILSPAPSYALSVIGVRDTAPLVIADLSITSADAIGLDPWGNGSSSITVVVADSTVALTRLVLHAGTGADGGPRPCAAGGSECASEGWGSGLDVTPTPPPDPELGRAEGLGLVTSSPAEWIPRGRAQREVGGGGGGASIALLSVNARVRVASCALLTSTGGQASGGAPGVSAAIVYLGPAPIANGAAMTLLGPPWVHERLEGGVISP